MSMTRTSADYFAEQAENWDQLRASYFTEEVRDAAIARAYLRPEMVVADVGSGTGFVAAGLAPLVRQVYVMDGSSQMLDVARRNLAQHSNVVYQVADGASLPLDNAAVDAVFANMYLHHCPDPLAAIREMVRVLKPGGRLVITDMDRHDHEWMRREMADEWLGFEQTRVKAWLREAGLVNVIVGPSSTSCCAASQTVTGEQARISVFVATGSRRVTGARDAVKANYGALAEGLGAGCSAEPASGTSCCSSSNSADPVDGSSCCSSSNSMELIEKGTSDSTLQWLTGYTQEQLAAVPREAAALSLGCGNPTAMASLKPGEVVLDIGSGAGIDAFYAARRVGPQGKVIGLDMTPAMIERARQSAEAAGLSQVEFRLGNAEDVPIADETVDIVLSNCVINLCEDKGKVFEEAFRVLREGGRLSISDMVTDKPFPMSWRGDPERWAGCVNGALPEAEYLDLVRQAGFTNIRAGRSSSGGNIEGISVYSLAVSAQKGPASITEVAGTGPEVIPLVSSRRCCG